MIKDNYGHQNGTDNRCVDIKRKKVDKKVNLVLTLVTPIWYNIVY